MCVDVKMIYRPPLLEEPFAQTLSGKRQVRFHRNIAASSLAVDCNVPQQPPAVTQSLKSIQTVFIHTDTVHNACYDQNRGRLENWHLIVKFGAQGARCSHFRNILEHVQFHY